LELQLASIVQNDGVNSVELQGENKNQMVVIGDGVDAAALTSSVRKKVKNASLEMVQQL
nr:heavy metal-associated isoprenylated plant protein 47-like [Tanacetum cinerariifolium]